MFVLSTDHVAFLVTVAIALSVIELINRLVSKHVVSPVLGRKLIHILIGPTFISCWPLFFINDESRFYAALVPLLITLKLTLVGLGILHDPSTVRSMSRTGNRRELLGGPLMYGVIFTLVTIYYWRTLIGIIAICLLCFGDGFADVVGRRFGASNRLPWTHHKSLAGSIGFFIASIAGTIPFYYYALFFGWTAVPWTRFYHSILLISAIATFVESLSPSYDNVTVFVSALIVDYFLI